MTAALLLRLHKVTSGGQKRRISGLNNCILVGRHLDLFSNYENEVILLQEALWLRE